MRFEYGNLAPDHAAGWPQPLLFQDATGVRSLKGEEHWLETLNTLGDEGWEFVQDRGDSQGIFMLFKRLKG